MRQIAFRSRLTQLLTYTDIQRLCLNAARNNRKAGITGFMVECGGVFIASLEGDARAVNETFDRIRRDVRHDHVEVVFCEKDVERRRFAAWAMNVMFLDDDAFWQTVFRSDFSCDEMLSREALEPTFAVGLLALAYRYACSRASIVPVSTNGRSGRIPRIGHMFRR